jgi:16S rRNA (cytosine967-C5)-methyltransferase
LDNFTANEIAQHRADLVAQVLPGENVIVGAGQDLSETRKYDRIMVDAPCTGLGALRRRPEARWRKTPQDLKELVVIQRELLDSAVNLLEDDGIIAYITCSPHNAETRLQTVDFLYRHKEFEIVDIAPWIPRGYEKARLADGSFQLWTDVDDADSMFLVLLRRKVV